MQKRVYMYILTYTCTYIDRWIERKKDTYFTHMTSLLMKESIYIYSCGQINLDPSNFGSRRKQPKPIGKITETANIQQKQQIIPVNNWGFMLFNFKTKLPASFRNYRGSKVICPQLYIHMCIRIYTQTYIDVQWHPGKQKSRFLTQPACFQAHTDEVSNPAWQCCFYKPLRNCHPSQQVSTNPLETKENHKNHMIFPHDFFCDISMIFPIYDISDFLYDFYRIK